ncbi:MAG TPA: cupredoxin domain-containing protein [Solirubrobacteraceae bacterium]|jgi:hypothetical protein
MVRLVALALVAALLVAAALVLRSGSRPPEPVRARDGRISVVMRDFRFQPQRIRARPGRLTFALRNEGRLAHAFRLSTPSGGLVEHPSLKPGERATVTTRVKRGRYRMFDALSNFEELGMYGTVEVR